MYYTLKNNSKIEIPEHNGAFIISTGCGSGKTTMYKEIIQEHWYEGVLYTVDSRKECISMYNWIQNNIDGIQASDVYMMFTRESDDTIQIMAEENLNRYKQNPEILLNKKVVIIPHPRLFSDIPTYFLVYNPTIENEPVFDGGLKTLMQRNDLRQYILIDETPQFFKPFVKICGSFPLMMEGHENEIEKRYRQKIQGRDYDPFKSVNTRLGRLKRETFLKMLPKRLPDWLNAEPQDTYSIQFWPKDLVQDGMKTNLLLAEGAGDILFNGQKLFQLIDVPKKYCSKLELEKFSFDLSRKEIPSILQKKAFIEKLRSIIEGEQNRVLIVVWKDFKNSESIVDSESPNDSRWRDDVCELLLNEGISQDRFAITYYGATDNKSTNDYRDCGAIVCCGKWHLPISSSDKLNHAYSGNCSNEDYNLYQYV